MSVDTDPNGPGPSSGKTEPDDDTDYHIEVLAYGILADLGRTPA